MVFSQCFCHFLTKKNLYLKKIIFCSMEEFQYGTKVTFWWCSLKFESLFLIIVCCNTDSRHFLWQTKLRRRRCNMGLTNNYFLFSFTKKYNHIYVTFDIWQSLLCLFLAQWIQVCQLTVWAGNKRAAVCPHCSIYTLLNNWTHHTYLPITHILDFNWFYQEWYIPNL